jgi:tetratricopeptide (TPR) repeat protein
LILCTILFAAAASHAALAQHGQILKEDQSGIIYRCGRTTLVATNRNELAAMMTNTIGQLIAKGSNDEALLLAEDLIAIQAPSIEVARRLDEIGLLYDKRGDIANAKKTHRAALDLADKTLPARDPERAVFLFNSANPYAQESNYTQAVTYLTKALHIEEDFYGPNSLQVAETLGALARLYRKSDDMDKAIAAQERVVSIRDKNGQKQP